MLLIVGIRLTAADLSNGTLLCPICGIPLRPNEMEAHYSQELEYLVKLSAAVSTPRKQQVSNKQRFY